MNVFIGHMSALEYWRSITLDNPGAYLRAYEAPAPKAFSKGFAENFSFVRLEDRNDYLPRLQARTPSFARCKPDADTIRIVEICGAGCFTLPITFIVSDDDMRFRSSRSVCRVHRVPFPRGSFVRVADGVFVSSPELCFLQMANVLSLSELLLLGYELCGSYTTHAGGYARRPPLSTCARLGAFLSRANLFHGVKKARRALTYLADASASPKESELALLLGLPRAMGGYGLGIPVMNQKVTVRKGARKASGSASRYVDLFWPEINLGVEYDSDQEHTGSEKISRDASRKNALFAAGMNVLTVTKRQLMDYAELEKVAFIIARHKGVSLRSVPYDEETRRKRLRWELLRQGT